MPLLRQQLLHRPLRLLREHLLPSSPRIAPAMPLLGQELRPRTDLPLLRHHLRVAAGGAMGERLDEFSSLLRHAAVWQPRRYRRRCQASIAASHAPSLAVPCAEERIPRCGPRPAKMIKFTLSLQLVCRKQKKFAQSSPIGLHTVAKSLHFVCNWYAGSQKEFAPSLLVSLHTVEISLCFVCTWFAISL